MAQPLRSLPPQIKNAPLVVPTRRVKFVRVEVIKASLLIRTTTVHYIIGVAWSNVRSLWVIRGHSALSNRCPLYPRKRTLALCQKQTSQSAARRTAEGPVLTEIGKPMLGIESGKNFPVRMAGWRSSNAWTFAYA